MEIASISRVFTHSHSLLRATGVCTIARRSHDRMRSSLSCSRRRRNFRQCFRCSFHSPLRPPHHALQGCAALLATALDLGFGGVRSGSFPLSCVVRFVSLDFVACARLPPPTVSDVLFQRDQAALQDRRSSEYLAGLAAGRKAHAQAELDVTDALQQELGKLKMQALELQSANRAVQHNITVSAHFLDTLNSAPRAARACVSCANSAPPLENPKSVGGGTALAHREQKNRA